MSPIPFLVRKSLVRHRLATLLTALAIALAGGLALVVTSVNRQADSSFFLQHSGFDAVLGARSSDIQLVLNTIYHLETSPGNIPWPMYEELAGDPRVKFALPYVVGDQYHGFRIVGTTLDIFESYAGKDGNGLSFAVGGPFAADDWEAVAGSFVARRLSLKKGDIIRPAHGTLGGHDVVHHDEFRITGVLEPTGTPMDRVIWIPIDQFYKMEGHVVGSGHDDHDHGHDHHGHDHHDHHGHDHGPVSDEDKQVSAVMVVLHDPLAGYDLRKEYGIAGGLATFAFPIANVMLKLYDSFGWVNVILEAVSILVIVVALAGVAAALYNTLNERRREFAILRALGASRSTVVGVVLGQAVATTLIGTVGAFVVYAGTMSAVASLLTERIGIEIALWPEGAFLVWIPAALTLSGLLAGALPAWRAYRVDVARNLGPVS